MPEKTVDLDDPSLFINRELSWLEFNDGVLREGLDASLPLLERLKFLAIVGSNLDEFFMVRVAGLVQQAQAKISRRDAAGMSPAEQLSAIDERVRRLLSDQYAGIAEVLGGLAGEGLHLAGPQAWTSEQRRFLRRFCRQELLAVLSPLGIEELRPEPLLPGGQLCVAALLEVPEQAREDGAPAEKIGVVPVPGQFPRFLTLPAESGTHLACLEDAIAENLDLVFPGYRVAAHAAFRPIRDADVAVESDEAGDLLESIERAVLDRRRRQVVRLSVSEGCDERILRWLREWSGLDAGQILELPGPLDAKALMDVAMRPGFEALREEDWPPQVPRDLLDGEDIFSCVAARDVLLFHPYESFEPVLGLLERAAEDPEVLAIKQTLYRTSGDSPVIRALVRAAEAGKQVTVLVELKARFDEARNVHWARRLEDAGAHVIYGIAGLKTHAKCLLIVRREQGRIRRYVHLSTGNYNDRTARLYSDVAILTRDETIGSDAAALFNLLTGYSEAVGWSRLVIAPTDLRRRTEELIEREIQTSTPHRPGRILAKLNSLEDKQLCKALYRASRAGVEVRLNVRGICCLRPGVEGVSETISVTSIVDRFLEHARIFYYHNGGKGEVYISSADWMGRNLDRRLELLIPVTDPACSRRLREILQTCLADDVKARRLNPDGSYTPVETAAEPVRCQEVFYQQALQAARAAAREQIRFRPIQG